MIVAGISALFTAIAAIAAAVSASRARVATHSSAFRPVLELRYSSEMYDARRELIEHCRKWEALFTSEQEMVNEIRSMPEGRRLLKQYYALVYSLLDNKAISRKQAKQFVTEDEARILIQYLWPAEELLAKANEIERDKDDFDTKMVHRFKKLYPKVREREKKEILPGAETKESPVVGNWYWVRTSTSDWFPALRSSSSGWGQKSKDAQEDLDEEVVEWRSMDRPRGNS